LVSSKKIGAEKVNLVATDAVRLVGTALDSRETVENGMMIPVGIPFSISRISMFTGRVESFSAKYRSMDVRKAPPGESTMKL